ncbi:hypothetical protein AtubIFM55763_008465 [Aspergillus tubingensis]|uniref:Pesticidal crystal protein N-terminal domain-containing protein n=2 Tax=Aspergillus subgen. Circumdati TaxID=2720871 RepID=A0A100IUQ7_ASPNG|nr:hypothetical protein TRIVIDRAFT_60319 [Aspergillus niger]GLA64429.1 hypothetical protein AtubIFM54640_006147 [Aspergillus tubingensis]GLA76593.1 hypothetical protein AtubIFM55763_008465 [Aspergillus tubingensis]GLA86115.1 hypothetical protein AtubIFM56815_010366 [Aspergillus tubingensis]GLB01077.1 hypothetical protein AtubIFM57143_010454 [Aspergillus tubingensis]
MAPVANPQDRRIVVPVRPHVRNLDPSFDLSNVININGTLKAVVSNALKAIPQAGLLLSGIVTAFWPDPSRPSLRWEEIDRNVRTIAQGLLDDDKVRELRQRIDSLYDLIKDYNQVDYRNRQKGEKLTFILSWLTVTRRTFIENSTPWRTLQYFVPMATLHLSFLREQYLHWDELYPREAAPPRLLEDLRDAIEIYTNAATAIQERCLRWRMDERIEKTQRSMKTWHLMGSTYHKYVCDHETGFSHEVVWGGPGIGPSQGYSHELEEDRYFQDLRDAADAIYQQQIDDLLAPSLQWLYFDPQRRYTPITRTIMAGTTGPMGDGISNGMVHFNDHEFAKRHGRITRVVIHTWHRVNGFEIWYGGMSSGFRGTTSHQNAQSVLEIGENESIVCVSGYVGKYLDSIRFFVSPERRIAGGGRETGGQGDPDREDNFRIGFKEDGPSNEPNTYKLQYVYGWSNNNSGSIEGFGAAFCRTETV